MLRWPLFAERARTVDRRFVLTAANVTVVGEICRRLDGIPLAIELAAARVALLSLDELEQKLDRRFVLLTGGARTALPRQQTMRATIEWSVALLSEAERILLGRLGVFADGWTVESAEAVCWGEPLAASDVFTYLASLVEKSLVTVRSRASFRSRKGTAGPTPGSKHVTGCWSRSALTLKSNSRFPASRQRSHAAMQSGQRTTASGSPSGGSMPRYSFIERHSFRTSSRSPNRQQALKWALGGAEFALLAARIAGTEPWFIRSADARRSIEQALALIDDTQHPRIAARLWMRSAVNCSVKPT